jgi:hypothetical protein
MRLARINGVLVLGRRQRTSLTGEDDVPQHDPGGAMRLGLLMRDLSEQRRLEQRHPPQPPSQAGQPLDRH